MKVVSTVTDKQTVITTDVGHTTIIQETYGVAGHAVSGRYQRLLS